MTRPTTVALLAALCACSGPAPVQTDAGMPELFDPLSMPETPTVSLDNFTSASTCGGCHTKHYAEWKTSMHSYALIDPVYRAIVNVRQADYDGLQDRFCLQCHTAIGTRSGDVKRNFSFDALASITLEGITCESCHLVSRMERDYNSGHVLDDTGPIRGPIANAAASAFHDSEHSDLFAQSSFCGGCHDVIEVSGLNLERPYQEWLRSPAEQADQSCQSCHMPEYTGSAAPGAPERTLHEHRWVGVDMPISDGFVDATELADLKTRIQSLLDTAASLSLDSSASISAGSQLDLYVTIENKIAAHNLPTGSTFNRQVWLDLTVKDGTGQVIYSTGQLDANGDLQDHFSELAPYGDADLIVLSSRFVDKHGNPEVFPWRAAELTNHSLSPMYRRTFTLFVPTGASTTGPLDIQARLRFRAFPPFLLRRLGLADKVDRVPIFDIATASRSVPVVP